MLTVLGVKHIDDVETAHARYFLLICRREKDASSDRAQRMRVLFDHLINAGLYHSSNPFAFGNVEEDFALDEACIRKFSNQDDYSWLPQTYVSIQIILPNRLICQLKDCGRYVPQGAYPDRQTNFFCSQSCRHCYLMTAGVGRTQCAHPKCENKIWFKPDRVPEHCYCRKHHRSEKQDSRDREECGPFLELFKDYFRNQANGHYVNPAGARSEIRAFLSLLVGAGVLEINGAGPEHVECFLAERRETNAAPRADCLKKMFDYLIENGVYRCPNPVMSRVHYGKPSRRDARPYDGPTMSQIWRNLEIRGNSLAKFVIAFGDESGPRAISICRSLVTDVQLENRRIWICSNNKSRWGGWVYFGPKTEHWLRKWLNDRPTSCGHKYLLTDARGGPMQTYSLWRLLKSILLKHFDGHVHDDGLDEFHFHRLRHTNTSRLHAHGVKPETNQKNHIWSHPSSREGYTRIGEDHILAKSRCALPTTAALNPRPPRMTMAEFVARRGGSATEYIENRDATR